jgi:hypothetical protein
MLAGNTGYVPSSFNSIASVTATGGETSFTLSSIPQTYKHLQLRYSGLLNPAGNITVRFNSNSTNNYYFYGAGMSGTSGDYVSTFGSSFYLSGATYGASPTYATVGMMDIYDYTSTTRNKSFKNFLGRVGAANTASEVWWWGGFLNSDTSAISSITIYGSNAFVAGSVFSLYGMSA